jgi:hypothetical protein
MQEMRDARATGPPNEIDVPDRTTVGVALITVAFRTLLALGNDTRSDPVAHHRARPHAIAIMGTLASG